MALRNTVLEWGLALASAALYKHFVQKNDVLKRMTVGASG